MASEEQKAALKTKIILFVLVSVIGFVGWTVGPGLKWHLERWRKKKTDPMAPVWYHRIASFYNATWREKDAIAVWEEFYLTWSGDEVNNPDLDAMMAGLRTEDWTQRWMVPLVANRYDEETNKRPAWIGGENAKPHPLLANVLFDWAKTWEDKREYSIARPLYAAGYYCFPKGTKISEKLEGARTRMTVKGFGF